MLKNYMYINVIFYIYMYTRTYMYHLHLQKLGLAPIKSHGNNIGPYRKNNYLHFLCTGCKYAMILSFVFVLTMINT